MIGGTVFEATDRDDTGDGGEPGIEGVLVELRSPTGP